LIRQPDGSETTNKVELKGLLDSSAFMNIGNGGIARGDQMNRLGCRWENAVKGPDSRIQGVQNLHRLLSPGADGLPRLQIFRTCPMLIKAIPSAPRSLRDSEDYDDFEYNHLVDSLRYSLPWEKEKSGFKKVRFSGT
jgi:hypothetical protein